MLVLGTMTSPCATTSGVAPITSGNPGTATITCTVGQKQATLVVTVQ